MEGIPPLLQSRLAQARQRFSSSAEEEADLLPGGYFHLLHIKPILQNGPQCGLVALKMAADYFETPAELSDIFEDAKLRGFTKQGEMFEAQDVCTLASSFCSSASPELVKPFPEHGLLLEELLQGSLALIAYDCDKNHEPMNRRGHGAHWALVAGFFVVDVGLTDVISCGDARVAEMSPGGNASFSIPDASSRVFLVCYHGKSKHPAVWSYDELRESNRQLCELGPARSEEEFVAKDKGLGGLRDQVVILRRKVMDIH